MPAPATSAHASNPDPQALLKLATRVAEQAADLLLDGAGRARISIGTKSTATDMVTEMDHASEELIVGGLLAARPDDGIVGEEGAAQSGSSGVRWIVDPLDGTTNYLYGHPGWAVSIAAEGTDGVLAGVVVDVLHHETYTAARGSGAQRNGEPIHCNEQTDLSQSLVATGFGYDAKRRGAQTQVLVDLLPQIRDIRRMGAASVDLCSVACGRVDAYFEQHLSWWDWAAGSLVAHESGAVVTSLDGGPLGDDAASVIAAAPGIAESLREVLDSLGASLVP